MEKCPSNKSEVIGDLPGSPWPEEEEEAAPRVEETAVPAGVLRPGAARSAGTTLEHAVPSPGRVNQNQVERASRATRATLFFTLIKPRKGR